MDGEWHGGKFSRRPTKPPDGKDKNGKAAGSFEPAAWPLSTVDSGYGVPMKFCPLAVAPFTTTVLVAGEKVLPLLAGVIV